MLANNQSCLLAPTLLRFAGFHRQPSTGLLRGLLYLEVCKSQSASGIALEITTFQESLLYFFVLSFAFFLRTQNLFVTCIIGSHRSQSQQIAAQASQKFNMRDFVATTQAFIAKAGIVSSGVHTSSDIERRCASC